MRALEELERDGVRVVRHGRNRGLWAARSTGLGVTSAPYVFPLDADDLVEPGVLGEMADRLDAHPEAGVCFGDYVEFDGMEAFRAVPERIDPFRLAYTNEYPVSALFRRDLLESVGGWSPIEAYEDWHLWITLAECGIVGVHLGRSESRTAGGCIASACWRRLAPPTPAYTLAYGPITPRSSTGLQSTGTGRACTARASCSTRSSTVGVPASPGTTR